MLPSFLVQVPNSILNQKIQHLCEKAWRESGSGSSKLSTSGFLQFCTECIHLFQWPQVLFIALAKKAFQLDVSLAVNSPFVAAGKTLTTSCHCQCAFMPPEELCLGLEISRRFFPSNIYIILCTEIIHKALIFSIYTAVWGFNFKSIFFQLFFHLRLTVV